MSPEDEVDTFLKAPTSYSDWAAMNNIMRMCRIEQNVEETVQKYVENVATTFDPSTLPSPPKKLDQNPGAALKL
ncbi:hypothetical protein BDA96_04G136700 [Sorghum bicolor]|uniref:Uncharacterized protein n=1 Tax=Sorghum bicolor TaxID=4558 RepID=A0A921UHZ4_SORBI|nr:hypothetical protein BDA96_04G136700 [Sorghum bicolor]